MGHCPRHPNPFKPSRSTRHISPSENVYGYERGLDGFACKIRKTNRLSHQRSDPPCCSSPLQSPFVQIQVVTQLICFGTLTVTVGSSSARCATLVRTSPICAALRDNFATTPVGPHADDFTFPPSASKYFVSEGPGNELFSRPGGNFRRLWVKTKIPQSAMADLWP